MSPMSPFLLDCSETGGGCESVDSLHLDGVKTATDPLVGRASYGILHLSGDDFAWPMDRTSPCAYTERRRAARRQASKLTCEQNAACSSVRFWNMVCSENPRPSPVSNGYKLKRLV